MIFQKYILNIMHNELISAYVYFNSTNVLACPYSTYSFYWCMVQVKSLALTVHRLESSVLGL